MAKFRPINITINGKPFKVFDPVVTYEELADMADITLTDEVRVLARQKTITVSEGSNINVKW